MRLRSTDCVTFTINIPQSPLFLCSVEQSNLNKMTPVRPASGCVHGGASCRQRSSAPVLERSAGSLSKQVGSENMCLSSFFLHLFCISFFKRRSWKCQLFQGRCLSGNSISWGMVPGGDDTDHTMWPFLVWVGGWGGFLRSDPPKFHCFIVIVIVN